MTASLKRAPDPATAAAARASGGRPRVLLVAYAVSPRVGSECAVGWQRAVTTARAFDTWVICDRRYEEDIERQRAGQELPPGLHFIYLERTPLELWLWRQPLGLYRHGYHRWQRRACRLAAALHREIGFDLVHQVNWTGFREPGYLWQLPVPFVWGPVGGTQNCPWRFLPALGLRGAMVEGSRNLANWLQLRLSRRVRLAARRAALVLAGNSTGQRDFARAHGVSPVLLLETGVEHVEHARGKLRQNGDRRHPLRILWSGVFEHHKGLGLLLEALGGVGPEVSFELRILGRGPLDSRWRRLARRRRVDRSCRWLGWLPYAEALEQYEWADLLVFTSLRDTSGNVILEALARGVPVVCLDHQGAGDIVTEACGIKLPVTTPAGVVADLRQAIRSLALDPARLAALARRAPERARDFLWAQNGERMAALYAGLLARRPPSGGPTR